MADLNGDGVVDGNEWEVFYKMLYRDFRTCDNSGDHMIQLKEAMGCFGRQDWMRKMTNEALTGKFDASNNDALKEIMKWTDRDGNGAINLAEYVFIRKSASAWRSCVTGQMMN